MHCVIELVVRSAQTRHLQVDTLRPVAEAAARLKAIATTEVLLLTAVEVQLITQDQPGAALFGESVIA